MNNGFRLGAPDIAYIGAGVTVKGAIVVPDAIIVDGIVEGDATAQSIRIGQSGAIKGKVSHRCRRFRYSEKADVKEFLLVRSSAAISSTRLSATDDALPLISKVDPVEPLPKRRLLASI